MRVCYVTLVAAPWLAIAGMLSALCGLLAAAAAAWFLALDLLWARVAASRHSSPVAVRRRY